MLATSATRPARFSDTMRRVRLEKLSAKKNWPARRSQPSGRCQPCAGGASMATLSRTRAGEAPSAFRLGSGFVEAVAHTVQGFDHLEIVVHDLELLAQPLDVAVDGAIVDIDLIVIGGVHQCIAAFH